MARYLCFDDQYSGYVAREMPYEPGYKETGYELIALSGLNFIFDTKKNEDETYSIKLWTGDYTTFNPKSDNWIYVSTTYAPDIKYGDFFVVNISSEPTEINVGESSLTGYEIFTKTEKQEDSISLGYGVFQEEKGFYLVYTSEGGGDGAVTSVFIGDKEGISYDPNHVYSIKPGVGYSKDEKRVFYNRKNGYYITATYLITDTNNQVGLCNTNMSSQLKSIYIDDKRCSITDLIDGRQGDDYNFFEVYAYKFNTVGYHTVTYEIKDPSFPVRHAFCQFDEDASDVLNNLVSVSIGEGITNIPLGCFEKTGRLKEVFLPSTLTGISDHAFYYCAYLSDMTIPNSVTSIGNYAFYGCGNLGSGFSVGSGVVELGDNVFSWTPYIMSGFCPNYGGIYYPSEKIAYAAADKTLTDYTLKEGTISVKNNCFSGCTSMTGITIPDTVTGIGPYAFARCYSLSSITLPEKITEIARGLFTDCAALTEITLPSGLKTIRREAFCGCKKISSLTLPSNIETMELYRLFYNCNQLTGITLPENATYEGETSSAFTSTKIASIELPTGITHLGWGTFSSCNSLTSVTAHALLERIYGTGGFNTCSSLTYFYGPNASDDNRCLIINDTNLAAFAKSGLTSYTISEGITTIGNSSFYSTSLKSISLPLSLKTIETSAFCASYLYSVSIPDSVETIGKAAFMVSYSLSSVTIGSGITVLPEDCFVFCPYLKSINIPDNVTKIDRWCFSGNTALTAITLGSGIKEIGAYAFQGASSLKNITCFAETAPKIDSSTFQSIKTGGTLYHTETSDYSTWMGTDKHYLGYSSWIESYI